MTYLSLDPAVDVYGEQVGGLSERAEASLGAHLYQVRGRDGGARAVRTSTRVRHRLLPRQADARTLQRC